MPTHAEQKCLPYTPEQMYALAADVEKYHEFLPWCLATRIKRRDGNKIVADMIVGFKMIREKFTSEVTLDENRRIDVVYKNGPFKYLNSHWIFEANPDGGCTIDFFIDFEFRTKLLQKIMGMLFNEAFQLMMSAFEKRAKELYGADLAAPSNSSRAS